MRILNLFFVLTLPILAMVHLAQAQDTAKYDACVQTQSCMEYSSIAASCGVDEDVDLTTPRLISSDQLQCLCLSSEFITAISLCLVCVGYSSVPWHSVCPSSSSSSSSTTSSSSSSSDGSSSSSHNSTSSIFDGDNPGEPLLGLNDDWSPRNTGIIIGSCVGGIALIAIVSICICVFRRRRNRREAVKEEPSEDGDHDHEHEHEEAGYGMRGVPVAQSRVRSDPEQGRGSRRERREGGKKHRGTRGTSRPRGDSHSPPRFPPDARLHPSARQPYEV